MCDSLSAVQWTLPTKEEPFSSYGFVEVDETSTVIRRSKSTSSIDREESLLQLNRNLEQQLRRLRQEVARLRQKVSGFEASRDRWGVRLTRRMALLANLLLAAWLFAARLLRFVHRRRRGLLARALMPALPGLRAPEPAADLRRLVVRALLEAAAPASPFALAAFLLARHGLLHRLPGALLAALASLRLALRARAFPWAAYLDLLSNVLYILSALRPRADDPSSAPTIHEFHRRGARLLPHHHHPTAHDYDDA
jgi:hypothetical protein